MKEYIISADEVETLEEILHTKFSFPEENELIRCKACESRKKNKFCLKNMKYKNDDGYCDEAVRKDEKSGARETMER